MDSKEIISSINGIYDRFELPASLRMHMYRVAAVANLVCDNWKGQGMDRQNVVAACLVHDLGNMAKVRFDELSIRILGDGARDAEHWKGVKERVIRRYGKTAPEATRSMLSEIGADREVVDLFEGEFRIFAEEDALYSSSWELKVLTYSDLRVGPFGILSVSERIADLKARHGSNFGAEAPWLEGNEHVLAANVERNIRIGAADINDASAEPYVSRYRSL